MSVRRAVPAVSKAAFSLIRGGDGRDADAAVTMQMEFRSLLLLEK